MTPDEELLKQLENLKFNIKQNNEQARETIMLLREIIPDELKKQVTSAINLTKLEETFKKRKDFFKQNHLTKPLNRMYYETGRSDGKFETILALLLEGKQLFNKNTQ